MSDIETVKSLIEQLNLHHADTSKLIVQKIVAFGDIAITPLYEAFYYSDTTGEKEYILEALTNLIDRNQLVEHLLSIIHLIHGFTRYYGLKYLLQVEDETVHHQLIPIMVESVSGHHYLGMIANEHLPHLGDSAMSQLIDELNEQSRLQTPAYDYRLGDLASILASFDDEKIIKPIIDALKSIKSNKEMYQKFIWIFEKVGVKAIPELLEILNGKVSSYSLKLCIVHICGSLRAKQSVSSLLPLLAHDNEEMRSWVAYALGDIRDKTTIPKLIKHLKNDPHEYVRIASANALRDMRDNRAIQPLIDTSQNDESIEVRRTAIGALTYYNDNRIVSALIHALHDEESSIAVMAGHALGDKRADARPQLQALHKQQPELIDRAFNTWKWEFINSCRHNAELQKSSLGEGESIDSIVDSYRDKAHDCPICGKSPIELDWLYLSTEQETWSRLMGRAGWQSVCNDCNLQVDFFLTTMN